MIQNYSKSLIHEKVNKNTHKYPNRCIFIFSKLQYFSFHIEQNQNTIASHGGTLPFSFSNETEHRTEVILPTQLLGSTMEGYLGHQGKFLIIILVSSLTLEIVSAEFIYLKFVLRNRGKEHLFEACRIVKIGINTSIV